MCPCLAGSIRRSQGEAANRLRAASQQARQESGDLRPFEVGGVLGSKPLVSLERRVVRRWSSDQSAVAHLEPLVALDVDLDAAHLMTGKRRHMRRAYEGDANAGGHPLRASASTREQAHPRLRPGLEHPARLPNPATVLRVEQFPTRLAARPPSLYQTPRLDSASGAQQVHRADVVDLRAGHDLEEIPQHLLDVVDLSPRAGGVRRTHQGHSQRCRSHPAADSTPGLEQRWVPRTRWAAYSGQRRKTHEQASSPRTRDLVRPARRSLWRPCG